MSRARSAEKKEDQGKTRDTRRKSRDEAWNNAQAANKISSGTPPTERRKVDEISQATKTGKKLNEYEYKNSEGKDIVIREDRPTTYPDGGMQDAHFDAGEKGKKLDQHHYYEKK